MAGIKATILNMVNAEERESSRVFLLLGMGLFMGIAFATLDVGAAALFLSNQNETYTLALAILGSGVLGIITTTLYNFFQNKVRFHTLATGFLFLVGLSLFGIVYALRVVEDPTPIYFLAFTFIIPSNSILLLVFWGAFGRMFNVRQSKRIIGGIDTGQLIASIVALFSIPIFLDNGLFNATESDLFTVSLVALVGNLLVFLLVVRAKHFGQNVKKRAAKISYGGILKNKYLTLMAIFVIISMITVNFIDYSFLVATQDLFNENDLAKFLSYFEATIVIFSFIFQTFFTDKIIAEYGLKVALLVNPILIAIFTAVAIPVGFAFGFDGSSSLFIIFFIVIAMSKLFITSLKDALDGPSFKLYFLPVDEDLRFDVQTKIEGVITAFSSLIAGGIFILFINVEFFTLIYVSIFTIPALFIWYIVTGKMHNNYRNTLQSTLTKNRDSTQRASDRQYAIDRVLKNEINSDDEDQILYGLRLMEKATPNLHESSVLGLNNSQHPRIREYVAARIQDDSRVSNSETGRLAAKAMLESEKSERFEMPDRRLAQLSKSVNAEDRFSAAQIMRKVTTRKNVHLLLELLRDAKPKVKNEAITTARKIQNPSTWPALIEMLDSADHGNAAAAALIEAGEKVLMTLEFAFHKSGQSDLVMFRIVQIMGRIGGEDAIELLWKKIEYPDKKILWQIVMAYRYLNYKASPEKVSTLFELVDQEIGKAIWNISAIDEVPTEKHFAHLKKALREELKNNFDAIYSLLSIIYDVQSIRLVRENVDSGTSDGIAFAIELLDLFLYKDLKPKLIPLIDDISNAEKLSQLQIHYPRENYTITELLNYLLNKNYNEVNRWTKACAIHAIAFMDDFDVSPELIAQLFHQDPVLQEVAAWVIFHKDAERFSEISKRLDREVSLRLTEVIKNNQLFEGLDDGAYLGAEMVMVLKKVSLFRNVKGELLYELVDRMHTYNLSKGEKLKLINEEEEDCIYIVAEGKLQILDEGIEIKRLRKNDAYAKLIQNEDQNFGTHIAALDTSVIFTLRVNDFYHVIVNYHELAQDFIKNLNRQKASAINS